MDSMSMNTNKDSNFAHPDRAKQLLSFEGLVYERNARPTDIDMAMEIGDREYLFTEVKIDGKEVPQGQKLFLSRHLSIIHQSGRKALGIIATHNIHDCHQAVLVRDCRVVSVWYEGQWHNVASSHSVESVIEKWRRVNKK